MIKTINTANATLHLSKSEAARWEVKKLRVKLLEIDELGNYIVEMADTRFRTGTILQFIGGREVVKCTKTFKDTVDYEKETHTGYVQQVTRKVRRTAIIVSTSDKFGAFYVSHGLEHSLHVEC